MHAGACTSKCQISRLIWQTFQRMLLSKSSDSSNPGQIQGEAKRRERRQGSEYLIRRTNPKSTKEKVPSHTRFSLLPLFPHRIRDSALRAMTLSCRRLYLITNPELFANPTLSFEHLGPFQLFLERNGGSVVKSIVFCMSEATDNSGAAKHTLASRFIHFNWMKDVDYVQKLTFEGFQIS